METTADQIADGTRTDRKTLGRIAAAALIAIFGMAPTFARVAAMRGRPPSWNGDIDTALIHGGLVKAPHFVDTLHWWNGTWAGQVPFYRPLSSYIFWIEWKLFGDAEWLYVIPAMAAHLAAVVLFAALAYRLAERYEFPRPEIAAIVAGWGFAGVLMPYRGEIAEAVFFRWKNQPDSFAALCAFAALLCYLQAQNGSRRLFVAAVVWYLASCGFKESAITLPLVCVALELGAFRGAKGMDAVRRLLVMFGVCAGFVLFRTLVLHRLGYTYGTNIQWPSRILSELLGPLRSTLFSGIWLGNAMGVALAIAIWRTLRLPADDGAASKTKLHTYLIAALGILAMWMVAGIIDMMVSGGMDLLTAIQPYGWIAGINRAFDPVTLSEAVATCAMLVSAALVLRTRRDALWLCLAWACGFLVMLAFSPGSIHRAYLPQGGYYLLYGFAATLIFASTCRPIRDVE